MSKPNKNRRGSAARVVIFVIALFLGLALIVYFQKNGGSGDDGMGGKIPIPFLGAPSPDAKPVEVPVSPGGEQATSAEGWGGGAPKAGAAGQENGGGRGGSGSTDGRSGSGRGGVGAGGAAGGSGGARGGAQAGGAAGESGGARGGGAQAGGGAGGNGGARSGGAQAGGAADGNGGARGAQAGGAARNPAVVRVTPVVLGTIENSIVVNGDVIASRQVSLYPQLAGKIAALHKRVGDSVAKNEITAYIDPSKPGEVFSKNPLRSTIVGTVIQAPFNVGDTVSTQSAIYIVGDLSSLVIETYIPERFTGSIKKTLAAEIYFDALPNETFVGIVREVSPIIDPASRTMRIQIQFVKQDPRIRSGMFATISLVINTKRDVPVIPRSAVINTYGRWIVFVADDTNIAQRREIATGLESDTEIEVISGLKIGERVVSAGQNFLSNGDPVRIAQ